MKKRKPGASQRDWSEGLRRKTEMNRQLYRRLFSGETAPRLGEAVRVAKSAVNDIDIRRTWLLIGDPSMRLK